MAEKNQLFNLFNHSGQIVLIKFRYSDRILKIVALTKRNCKSAILLLFEPFLYKQLVKNYLWS